MSGDPRNGCESNGAVRYRVAILKTDDVTGKTLYIYIKANLLEIPPSALWMAEWDYIEDYNPGKLVDMLSDTLS